MTSHIPSQVLNWIGGEELAACSGQSFPKLSPHTGEIISQVTRSASEDVGAAVAAAKKAQKSWAMTPSVKRGEILFEVAQKMQQNQRQIAEIVALETGKSLKDAMGETGAAIAQGFFMAGEGARLFGRTSGTGIPNRMPLVVREPVGVCGLLISFNTPIANITWKVFPALICGNAVVLKGSEDTPLTAWIFSKILRETSLPAGLVNIVHGFGTEAGTPLVQHPDVALVSFTGSSNVGKQVATVAASRLAKVFLELGGKNPFVVCDEADLENAAKWALLSSFSNAGQRCAATSRILIFDSIYDSFREMLVEKTRKLKVGPSDDDDLGPVINERSLAKMETAVSRAVEKGARVLVGGGKLTGPQYASGSYMAPTLLENVDPLAEISCTELFGPVACLYRVKDFDAAIEMANLSPYGLTAAIHTRSYNRAMEFTRRIQSGLASVNGGTHGSEPHMPFGGIKNSGTGGREPGPEALDVYTNLKVINHNIDPTAV
jgi:acyl-CoA reductase-like NAD-dependent aldehyde dehydrogenase